LASKQTRDWLIGAKLGRGTVPPFFGDESKKTDKRQLIATNFKPKWPRPTGTASAKEEEKEEEVERRKESLLPA
jgi:hypothetical protein